MHVSTVRVIGDILRVYASFSERRSPKLVITHVLYPEGIARLARSRSALPVYLNRPVVRLTTG